jgi:hypothetical protein
MMSEKGGIAMKNLTIASKRICKEKKHEIVYIGSFSKHEGISIDTLYCKDCNCTWNEM